MVEMGNMAMRYLVKWSVVDGEEEARDWRLGNMENHV